MTYRFLSPALVEISETAEYWQRDAKGGESQYRAGAGLAGPGSDGLVGRCHGLSAIFRPLLPPDRHCFF